MNAGARLIAEARKRAGITQQELATRLDSHQSVIARWENGHVRPDLETVLRAVRAAGFDLSLSLVPADDHDVTLIRRELRIAPHERLRSMVEAVRAFGRMGAARGRV